ncbi:hypothetical protein J6TS7_51570 [Paenibacillus dendritiformis]|nr:hypothetical protein J6TS7_51570 [Paenibacillus dendritiformis]
MERFVGSNLKKDYPAADTMLFSRSNLNKSLRWTSSCYNEWNLKGMMLHIEKGVDGFWEYFAGVYSERNGCR